MTRINGKWRRRSIALTGTCVLLVAAACGGESSGSGKGSISVAAFGGAYGEAEAKAYFQPYQESSGVNVKALKAEASLAQVSLQVKNDNVSWDIVELAGPDAVIGCRDGLLEKIEFTDEETAALADGAAYECGLVSSVAVEGIGYDPKKFSTPPTWEDFLDFKKYPGKRAIESYLQDGTLEHVLIGSGIAKEDLYPLDLERATATLKAGGDNLQVVDSLGQASQLLTSGQVVMTQTASGRILPLQAAGLSVEFNPIGARIPSVFAIPKGAPHAAEAKAFLKYLTTCVECTTTMGELTGYSGANQAGSEKVTGDAAAYLPTDPEIAKSSFPLGVEWWSENAEPAQKAFDAFTTGSGN